MRSARSIVMVEQERPEASPKPPKRLVLLVLRAKVRSCGLVKRLR